jgi:hypothetical protein
LLGANSLVIVNDVYSPHGILFSNLLSPCRKVTEISHAEHIVIHMHFGSEIVNGFKLGSL